MIRGFKSHFNTFLVNKSVVKSKNLTLARYRIQFKKVQIWNESSLDLTNKVIHGKLTLASWSIFSWSTTAIGAALLVCTETTHDSGQFKRYNVTLIIKTGPNRSHLHQSQEQLGKVPRGVTSHVFLQIFLEHCGKQGFVLRSTTYSWWKCGSRTFGQVSRPWMNIVSLGFTWYIYISCMTSSNL